MVATEVLGGLLLLEIVYEGSVILCHVMVVVYLGMLIWGGVIHSLRVYAAFFDDRVFASVRCALIICHLIALIRLFLLEMLPWDVSA